MAAEPQDFEPPKKVRALVEVIHPEHVLHDPVNHGKFALSRLNAFGWFGDKGAVAVASGYSGVISGEWAGVVNVSDGLNV